MYKEDKMVCIARSEELTSVKDIYLEKLKAITCIETPVRRAIAPSLFLNGMYQHDLPRTLFKHEANSPVII